MGGIVVSIEDATCLIRLDAPPANSFNSEMATTLLATVADIRNNSAVRAVVITGTGDKLFCAGSDLKELDRLAADGKGPAHLLNAEAAAFEALAALPVPTVAAINGDAIGGGLELALCCDFILAADHAKLSLPEIALGVFPGLGATARLPARIGTTRAIEMMMLGRPIVASLAESWGLINRCVAGAELMGEALKLGQKMARGPSAAMAAIKASVRAAEQFPMREAVEIAREYAISHGASPEVAEGLRAFLSKERPNFTAIKRDVL